jgi:hypothetical protein
MLEAKLMCLSSPGAFKTYAERNPNPLLVGIKAGATTLEKKLETS